MKRVLLVEDEAAIADSVVYALQTEGFETAWVSTADEALANLADTPPHLVILDIGLPDISGLDLLQEMRKTTEVPVIFLTARATEIDRVVGLEVGADDYIVKPFSPREHGEGEGGVAPEHSAKRQPPACFGSVWRR